MIQKQRVREMSCIRLSLGKRSQGLRKRNDKEVHDVTVDHCLGNMGSSLISLIIRDMRLEHILTYIEHILKSNIM